MKSLVTFIAVIALAAPVFATVDIVCDATGPGEFTISYENASEDLAGISLIVTLTGGDGALNACGDATATAPFNTHIDYWNTTGGTPVLGVGCPVGAVGVAGLPTFSSTSFAISTGVLEDPPAGAPADGGAKHVICTIQLTGTTDTTVTMTADVDRGGCVGTSTNEVVAAFSAPCLVVFGDPEPACWAFPTQCHGDGNGDGNVDTVDFPEFRDGFGSCAPAVAYTDNICADYNHDGCIDTVDFPEFRDNFGGSPPADCP